MLSGKVIYAQKRLKEIDAFEQLVKKDGHPFLRKVLDDKWFSELKYNTRSTWMQKNPKYNCRFFPFRWLVEEGEWSFINQNLEKVLAAQPKRAILREKLSDTAKLMNFPEIEGEDSRWNKIWKQALSRALEIKTLCGFANDGFLENFDVRLKTGKGQNVDALINIDNRNIVVEVTACTVSLVDPRSKQGVINVADMIQQIKDKIDEKTARQLVNLAMPTMLIITLPSGPGADHLTARIAVIEAFKQLPLLSSVVISDSYLFKYGAWYFNKHASFVLTSKEKEYVSSLLLPNGAVVNWENTL